MVIIPALDMRAGRLVRPDGGRREGYRPWRSPLVSGGDLASALASLRRRFAFPVVYLADLDRLAGGSDFDPRIYLSLVRRFPGVDFWIDAALGREADCRHWPDHPALVPIVASETLEDLGELARIASRWGRGRFILSLDCRAGRIEGPKGLLEALSHWPEGLIVLDLARVAKGRGPNRSILRRIIARLRSRPWQSDHRIIVGGGIRDARDIGDVMGDGAQGVLAASALHEGTLGKAQITALNLRFRRRIGAGRQSGPGPDRGSGRTRFAEPFGPDQSRDRRRYAAR